MSLGLVIILVFLLKLKKEIAADTLYFICIKYLQRQGQIFLTLMFGNGDIMRTFML